MSTTTGATDAVSPSSNHRPSVKSIRRMSSRAGSVTVNCTPWTSRSPWRSRMPASGVKFIAAARPPARSMSSFRAAGSSTFPGRVTS